ncbi:putative chromosome segregation ATPase [Magnetofaba australis IT-1]|uniref:Putative chromosome segregation ATPase n=1 Tax=Magnetofaba australis IT-1 TaxID=1434232 RepID=A0A1Y2JZV4_9PROT|nr:putative chromosome segregation ATPase [Magnetofaba australis IT-1]
MVDADPQGNATTFFGIDKEAVKFNLMDIMTDEVEIEDAIVEVTEKLDILCGTQELNGTDIALQSTRTKFTQIGDRIADIEEKYDYILIDSPPSIGTLTINVMAAADKIFIAMQPEFLSLEGISQLIKSIKTIQEKINPELSIGKIIINRLQRTEKSHKLVLEEIKSHFQQEFEEEIVTEDMNIALSPSFGRSSVNFNPYSSSSLAYMKIACKMTSSI